MIGVVILSLSISLQLTAAYFSLRLIAATGRRLPWILLATSLIFMAMRQGVTLGNLLTGDGAAQVNLTAEVIALVISLLLAAGLLNIGPVINAFRASQEILSQENEHAASYLLLTPAIVVVIDAHARVLMINHAGCSMLGYDQREILGRDWFQNFVPENDRQRAHDLYVNCMAGEMEFSGLFENEIVAKGGGRIPISWANMVIRDSDGAITGTFSTGVNISERLKAVAALQDSEEKFRTLTASSPIGVFLADPQGVANYLNKKCSEIIGTLDDDPFRVDWAEYIHPDDREMVAAARKRMLEDGEESHLEYRWLHADGEIVWALREFVPLRNGDGEISGYIGTLTDITQRKRIEEQLRQSQKMEAVGQLTGGMAHDFNNLLAIIQGNLSLLAEDLEKDRDFRVEDVRQYINPALRASRRGAELSHRLLAFSRKQALQPVVMDVNQIVQGMDGLLRTTLGENIDLSWKLECRNWRAKADVAELENALLNLALNARDAMPKGGALTIETAEVTLGHEFERPQMDVKAGDYIVLSVSDTGAGMEAHVVSKVFEPFFTTKDVGKGSGLGLSMVYSFAVQSGGHVEISSELSKGTTVKLYLPRSFSTEDRASTIAKEATSAEGHGTILVVEDDEEVRCIAKRFLEHLGYAVLEAEDGQTAMNVLNEDSVDLLLTDVVLPGGMNGPEIAKLAQQKKPELRILYMSGYTRNAVMHHDVLTGDIELLTKPFSREDLGNKIRELLKPAA